MDLNCAKSHVSLGKYCSHRYNTSSRSLTCIKPSWISVPSRSWPSAIAILHSLTGEVSIVFFLRWSVISSILYPWPLRHVSPLSSLSSTSTVTLLVLWIWHVAHATIEFLGRKLKFLLCNLDSGRVLPGALLGMDINLHQSVPPFHVLDDAVSVSPSSDAYSSIPQLP